ncbi:YceD family protein [Psychrobacter aestuarii]|uniref:Large ribosomal RNA subunit accumulation protein YceD n=1 Tax=Psychrobacter aestuarii TaxID=556327 RepID=A0ABN0VVT0_9GAMM|nr:YceD family protein [Psychrobacter aestuarii]
MTTTPTSEQVTHNKNTDAKTLPEHIVLDKWADSGFEWAGDVDASVFERVSALLSQEHAQSALGVQATLYRDSNVLHLSFKLNGTLWLTCQRCLQPVDVSLDDDFDIALLDDDSQTRLLDDTQDYLLLDEVVIQQSSERLLPFKQLIEDEILLKLPMSPKHDDCEMAVEQVGEIEEEDNENPFAALAALKGKLS